MSRYPNFIDGTVSDYGSPEPSYPLWMKLSASVVVVSCAWCLWQVIA